MGWPARDFDLNEIHDGSFVRITWDGGNGPHTYRVVARGVPGERTLSAWLLESHPGPSVHVGPIGSDLGGVALEVHEIDVLPRCDDCFGPADIDDSDRVQCESGAVVCPKCCVSFRGESYSREYAWRLASTMFSVDMVAKDEGDARVVADVLENQPLPRAKVSPRGRVDFEVAGQWTVCSPDDAVDLALQLLIAASRAKADEEKFPGGS